MNKKFVLLLLPLIISGCVSLDPTYEKPSGAVSESLPNGGGVYSNLQENTQSINWENYIVDEKIKKVIAISLENNKDLKIALQNIEAARAQYGVTDSSKLPSLSVGANGSKGENLNGQFETFESNVGFNTFEIDFFGRVKSLSTASLESFLATKEAQKTTKIAIISETLKNYIELANNKSKLSIAKENYNSAKSSLELIQLRSENGIGNEIDLSNAQTILYRAEADIFRFNTLIEQNKNALNVIAGTSISDSLLPRSLNDLENSIKNIEIGISSDVLLNRPDIIQAEHSLKAANANIGAARAAFFPRITLTANGGVASNQLSSLFSGTHGAWIFSPSISIPIFNNGYNQSNLDYAKAQKEIAILNYEKAIQTAFREVADELAQKGTIDEQIAAYNNLFNASKRSFDLSQRSYEEGIYNYLEVLTAQRNLYSVQLELLDIKKQKLNNFINLYKALSIN